MAPEYDARYAAARTASIDADIKSHQDAIKALRETKKQYAAPKNDADSE